MEDVDEKSNKKMKGKVIIFENLKKLAHEKGTSMNQVAKVMGMSPQNLIRIQRDRKIQTDYLEKLCLHYDIPFTYFLYEDSNAFQVRASELAQENALLTKKLDKLTTKQEYQSRDEKRVLSMIKYLIDNFFEHEENKAD